MKKSELRQIIKEEIFKVKGSLNMKELAKNESVVTEAVKEVVLSNEILDFLEERGILKASDAQKVHKDLTAFLKEKGINESYASSFGGSRNEDWKMVEDTLNREGYDTPHTGLWDQIMVEKNGVLVGKINRSGNYYHVYPNGIYNNTPYKWMGLDGFLKKKD